MRNHEVTEEQLLLNQAGLLTEPGWARRLVWHGSMTVSRFCRRLGGLRNGIIIG